MFRFVIITILTMCTISLPAQMAGKIDIKLQSVTRTSKQAVVIVMKEQADISPVRDIKGKDAKATFVYHTLLNKANETQGELLQFLKKEGISHRSFYIVNMISAMMDLSTIERIATREDVSKIIQDGSFKMLDQPESDRSSNPSGSRAPIWNLTQIGAPAVWSMGYTGQNVVIGGQDTGYAWEVNAIKSKYRGWNGSVADHNYNWHDAIHFDNPMSMGTNLCGFNSPFPCDDNNHGTHTMGTMVGSVDNNGDEIGVAPGAKWIGCRNMENGYGTLTTYVECFEWFLAPYPVTGGAGDPTKMPHVINNSWGCPTVEGCNTTNFATMEAALNNLRNAGCVIVVSAGNAGPNCNSVDDPAAIFSGSFSVGATNNSNGIANFSSRGAVSVDGSFRLKPNISAPGVDIRSCLRNGTFANYQGTSMAGPHVAGLVALLISANPQLAGEVDKIEDIIEQTALNLTTSTQSCDGVPGTSIPNNTFGWGRIDAVEAVNIAMASNYPPYVNQPASIVVSSALCGIILVSANNNQYRIQVNNSGQLTKTLVGTHAPNSMLVNNGSLNMLTSNSKIILRSPNNTYWQLIIDNNGQLSTSVMSTLPTNIELSTGDLKVSDGQKGILLRSPDTTCFLTNISNTGNIITIPAICIN
jgi:serine protease AprX